MSHVANNLNEDHELGTTRELNAGELRHHLISIHGVSVREMRTKGELGRFHLLAHTLEAFPELNEVIHSHD